MTNKLVSGKTDIEQISGASNEFMRQAAENLQVSLRTLSDKNRKEYEATMRMWSRDCDILGFDPFDFDLIRVETFLTQNKWSFNTRKTRLAHLRKFAELIALADKKDEYGFASNFGRLALLKPKTLGGKKDVLKKTQLTSKQIYKLFDSLDSDNMRDTRNRAILGLMLLGGLRASEIVALKWEHIDFEAYTLFIYEGKGEKSLHIPMLGDLPSLLKAWQAKLSKVAGLKYVCVWITSGDIVQNVKKMLPTTINNLTSELGKKTGVDFRPHDARRTIISELLNNGATVAQARDFARHSSGETTLRYAQKTDAKALGTLLNNKLKYGDVLGASGHTEYGRDWECGNGHSFFADIPLECPICGNGSLINQTSMFDD
jgi:integrase